MVKKNRANTNTNIFGLTKKGEYKYKYEYFDLYLQMRIQIQIFVTHCGGFASGLFIKGPVLQKNMEFFLLFNIKEACTSLINW